MKILSTLEPTSVQRFALARNPPRQFLSICIPRPPDAESMTKPLGAIARRRVALARIIEHPKIDRSYEKMREGAAKNAVDSGVRANVRMCVCNIDWHTLTAATETGLKCWNYLRGLCIYVRSRARHNCSARHNAPLLYSDARRNGSLSTPSKKGFPYRWNVVSPTVGSVIRLRRSVQTLSFSCARARSA